MNNFRVEYYNDVHNINETTTIEAVTAVEAIRSHKYGPKKGEIAVFVSNKRAKSTRVYAHWQKDVSGKIGIYAEII